MCLIQLLDAAFMIRIIIIVSITPGGYKDKDGYIWITGRIDDMVNVSGHLLSTAEIESALVEHPAVTEAAVVSHPHPIKGECTYSFVTTKQVGLNFIQAVAWQVQNLGFVFTEDYDLPRHVPSLIRVSAVLLMGR